VELVYGYATWLIHGRLPLAATAVGYVVFAAVMYSATRLRDTLTTLPGPRRPPAQAVTA
jgi:hypothetical protein